MPSDALTLEVVKTRLRVFSSTAFDHKSERYIRDFCKENGTFIDYTITYKPEQNGKAERYSRSLLD